MSFLDRLKTAFEALAREHDPGAVERILESVRTESPTDRIFEAIEAPLVFDRHPTDRIKGNPSYGGFGRLPGEISEMEYRRIEDAERKKRRRERQKLVPWGTFKVDNKRR